MGVTEINSLGQGTVTETFDMPIEVVSLESYQNSYLYRNFLK